MKVTILDTKTGSKSVSSGIRTFEWTDNEYSCDCNRSKFFSEFDYHNKCECERFIIVNAELENEDDYEASLYELNADYPAHLLKTHGI